MATHGLRMARIRGGAEQTRRGAGSQCPLSWFRGRSGRVIRDFDRRSRLRSTTSIVASGHLRGRRRASTGRWSFARLLGNQSYQSRRAVGASGECGAPSCPPTERRAIHEPLVAGSNAAAATKVHTLLSADYGGIQTEIRICGGADPRHERPSRVSDSGPVHMWMGSAHPGRLFANRCPCHRYTVGGAATLDKAVHSETAGATMRHPGAAAVTMPVVLPSLSELRRREP